MIEGPVGDNLGCNIACKKSCQAQTVSVKFQNYTRLEHDYWLSMNPGPFMEAQGHTHPSYSTLHTVMNAALSGLDVLVSLVRVGGNLI